MLVFSVAQGAFVLLEVEVEVEVEVGVLQWVFFLPEIVAVQRFAVLPEVLVSQVVYIVQVLGILVEKSLLLLTGLWTLTGPSLLEEKSWLFLADSGHRREDPVQSLMQHLPAWWLVGEEGR